MAHSFGAGTQDVQTAFDSVRHADALQSVREAGALPHQVLAMAREMHTSKVTLNIQDVAKTDPIQMTKAMKTGGRREPDIFVRMFDEVLQQLEGEWADLGLGFTLPDSGIKLTSVAWVDMNFILASSLKRYEYMARTLTLAL